MACDHLVGLYEPSGAGDCAELLPASQVDRCGAYELAAVKRALASGRLNAISVAHYSPLDTGEKALAKRLALFDYCPRCGERLAPQL